MTKVAYRYLLVGYHSSKIISKMNYNMKKIIIIVFFIPCLLGAQDVQLEKYVDSLMAPVNRTDMPGTMLLIAKDGMPLIRKTYGMANLELQVATRPDHLFAIGSVSKQFTAVAILQLAWKGKLNLSDDIRKYLPEFNTHGKLITIGHLLTHTSGIASSEQKDIGDFIHAKGIYSDKEFMEYAMKPEHFFVPGSDWSYNNFGFNIAAIIIEKLSGVSFAEYMSKNIFQPAGMTNSFVPDETKPLKNLVTSYFKDRNGGWMYYFARKWLPARGSGNIISTMDDMLKWDIALREEKILPKEWLEKAWTTYKLNDGRNTDYGLGWTVAKNNGIRFFTHGGDIYGYHTYAVHVPEKKIYLLCANFYATSTEAANILRKIVPRLLSLSYPSPVKAVVQLDEYASVYEIHRTGTRIAKQLTDRPIYMNISVKGDSLYAQQTLGEKIFLRPAGKDTFLPGTSEASWIVFTRDANQKVNALYVNGVYWSYGPEVQNKKVNIKWPAPVEAKPINTELLKQYAGAYHRVELETNFPLSFYFIETDGVKLYSKFEGKRQELTPVSDNKFVRKGVEDIIFEFKSATNGAMILTVSALRVYDYRKIN